MEISRLIVDPSTAVLAVGLLGLLGLLIWWLVRKRQKRVWLPTVRVMDLDARVLPRLVLRPPSLLGFLCFLIAALVLVGFTLRPRTQIFTPFEPNQTRIHIFADMSPSVASQMTLDDYAARIAALYGSLKESGRITVSTSHGLDVIEPSSSEDLKQKLTGLGFHRAGFKLGPGMKLLLEDLGEIDRLFIVSDRDQHTWTGFNWQYLQGETDVRFVDVAAGSPEKRVNVYVNDARFVATPTSQTVEWDVDVARRGPLDATNGKLTARYNGKTLGVFPFKFSEGKPRQTVRVSWPLSEQDAAMTGTAGGRGEQPLIFQLEIAADVLPLDDEFRTQPLGSKQDVLLVSEPAGERILEDPSTQLHIALQVLGFNVHRQDFIEQPGPTPEDQPLWVLVGGAGNGEHRFCPESLVRARLAPVPQGEAGPRLPKVWLAPNGVEANYKDMCRCYTRLVLAKRLDDPAPAYCENLETRTHWTALLQSLGAKQIGGDIGDAAQTVAWLGRDAASRVEVLAFTVPLNPQVQTGITYASFPVLVKELLGWQQIIQPSSAGTSRSWPRIDDLASALWKPVQGTDALLKMRSGETNIPAGESALAEIESTALPPRWTAQATFGDKQLPSKQDREDPLPWLKFAAVLATGVCALEGGVMLATALARFMRKRPDAAALLALGLFGATLANRAEAKIAFNLIGYGKEGPMTLASLSREVSHRTSIELATRPEMYTQLQPETFAEPWLWVRDLSAVTGQQGQLKPELVTWVKRGGFLILESPASDAQLKQLSTTLLQPGAQDVWMPLPPDHELMRSFYLLDALPTCNGQIWRGLHFDGRLAVLSVPYGFLSSLKDKAAPVACENPPDQERSLRIFVNMIMVALATDYKKDQIHLPEILKRLR